MSGNPPGRLERLLAAVSPRWACQRAYYREVYGRYRAHYSAAGMGPRSAGWSAAGGTGEQLAGGERDIIRGRARDLERNSDILAAALGALERNVVGTGLVLQAKVRTPEGGEDEEVCKQIEAAWRAWCRPGGCEVSGRYSFGEVCLLLLRRRQVDGGILVVKGIRDRKFQLQILEVDDLDTAVQSYRGRRVVGGIEIDGYRRPLAYHVKVYDAWGIQRQTQRLPAEQVLYLCSLTRPSQIREVSPLAPAMGRVDDADELLDAAVEKERVLAHLSLAVKSSSGSPGLLGRGAGGPPTQRGAPPDVLEQGSITYLAPGEEIQTIAPAGTSSSADPILKTSQRLIGGSIGLSYEAASRDMSQVNYSSARQGLLEDQRTYRMQQQYLIDHFCEGVYGDWLDWAVLSGQVALPGYWEDPQRYRPHVWIGCGWSWIDPLKEVNANARAVETGQATLQEINAAQGKDWREVLRQRAIEESFLEKLKLKEDTDA